jgi:protein TonB
MKSRYFKAVAAASVVTPGLLMLMIALLGKPAVVNVDARPSDEFSAAHVHTGPITVIDAPEITVCPPPRRAEPAEPSAILVEAFETLVPVRPPKPLPATPAALVTTDLRLVDTPPTRLGMIKPSYPRAAADSELEGWVLVEFDISAAGSVENARVIRSSHAVFEAAALRAVEKTLYRPRVVDGEALPMRGLRKQIVFEMERG